MTQGPELPAGNVRNVVRAASGGVVQVGTVAGGVHLHVPSRPVVALPYRAGIAPPRAVAFQDRVGSRLLAQTLDRGGAAVLSSGGPVRAGVVSGLGGVGKTQLAVDYAEQLWAAGEVDVWVWVTAGSREAIVSSYARLAIDLTGIVDHDPEHGAQRLLERLATTPVRWLVVLDDLQSPEDLRGLWPPATATGRVVVTTRRHDAALRGPGRQVIEIGVFTPDEAHGYLRGALAGRPRSPDGTDDRGELEEVARELGFLPLALAQAAAYMLDRNLTCAAYRRRLADRRRRLASLLPEGAGLPDEYRATAAVTWSLSVEQANRLAPAGLARSLLAVASVLDANGIPLEVFAAPAVLGLLTAAAGREVSGEEAVDGLGCLQRLSLVTLDPQSSVRAVRVHALVQRATRDSLSPDRLAVVVRAGADALLGVWPEIERDVAVGQVLRANTDAVAEAGGRYVWEPETHPLLFRAGHSLGESGGAAQARDYFHRLHTTATERLGPEHPDALLTRTNFARWRAHAGDLAGAVAVFEELVADYLRVLGPDHPDTLLARDYLATWRGRAGDPIEALAALEELVADEIRVLGPEHPDTLLSRHYLATWRGRAGDPAGAAAAFEELLADEIRVSGPEHPDTLLTRHYLARWRGHAGDPAGALAAFEELLTDYLRVLGPEHPNTLTTRHYLAYWRGHAGDPAGALAAFEELVTDYLRVLGPEHPNTLTTRHHLATWRGKAGDPAGAVSAFEELLADEIRVLGPEHPDTLLARANLATWRGKAGDPAGAVSAFEELLADEIRVLGPERPDTLFTRANLARWRGHTGNPAGAVAGLAELLTDYLRVLGPEHPDTVTTRHYLAYWRGRAGDPTGAAAAEELPTDEVRASGPDHPDTRRTRANWHERPPSA
ncbi:FxSxx-COOH system tetratricopeptide repeat protein [Amycolatopsis sp. NPDC059021]|uniref:FxSxx-COOH system tetratricopeptide repeat protein n=1 Tax=Amycolatopsis sp. NPDC059021 TaxID=3346704 RepID=UPI00366B993D